MEGPVGLYYGHVGINQCHVCIIKVMCVIKVMCIIKVTCIIKVMCISKVMCVLSMSRVYIARPCVYIFFKRRVSGHHASRN